ncbi:HAD family hydrolase [Lactobacillus sp. CC-MHH1034]|uniref:Cof-type HAD-IIB family hydrolase n=1 Tax=Agrilactobacillus fermenti TaxID=2586909 RepID=UPI001E3C8D3C|nr:Cof-type HAD-IIB family hydrolase [Agrilactobacillus fermenti]MCD2256526.1 HAD family hydrolase [Agrilactobacillus fermenti]
MTIKLIVTDIDGTFFDDHHDYDVNRFNAQLAALHQRGIRFVVASGNQLRHLQRIFAQKSPLQTFIAENGAHIVDGQTVITQKTIPTETVRDLVAHVESDAIFAKARLRLSGQHATYVAADDPTIHEPLTRYYLHDMHPVADLQQVQDAIYKVNLDWPQKSVAQQAKYLNELFGTDLFATPSGSGSIDVIPKGVNKAWGITQLQAHWHISPDEIMAFGDNYNDLEMLQHVGHGYVMKNAPEQMRQLGLNVTKYDNNHSGVLDVLDQLLAS